ncbi:hypothetical protein [Leisingera sp.]|uniref:DUF4376 domain-containing protein n=1 Tax=Leisingera sp. TaxID=1879318 RepID=UPI002B26CD92|nr:hypothetical protein [Leisingera sp.]
MPSFGQNAERARERRSAALIAELERRLEAGFDYNFGEDRGVHRIGTTKGDMARWVNEVSPAATALINLGQPDGAIRIKTDTGPVSVTAFEWQQILAAAAMVRQPAYQAYFDLKATDPIPSDFNDDKYWP